MSRDKSTGTGEIPRGSLGAAARAAFNMSDRAVILAFAKGNLKIDGVALNATHLRRDAEEYRGRYLAFYDQQALLVGHRLVRSDEQLTMVV